MCVKGSGKRVPGHGLLFPVIGLAAGRRILWTFLSVQRKEPAVILFNEGEPLCSYV